MERRTRLGIACSLLVAVTFLSFPSAAVGRAHRGARRLRWRGDDLETFVGIDVVDRSDVPFAFDTIGHALLWGTVGLIVLAMATSPSTRHPHLQRWWSAIGLVAISAAVEVGQGVLTTNRNAQWSDLAANTVGVLTAFVVVTLVAGRLGRSRRSTVAPAV